MTGFYFTLSIHPAAPDKEGLLSPTPSGINREDQIEYFKKAN